MQSSPNAAGSRKRVAIVYHYLAHYRKPVFESLCRTEGDQADYFIIASDQVDEPALKVLHPNIESAGVDIFQRWMPVRNFFIGPFLWQAGLLRVSARRDFDTIIFLGNAYFLSTWVHAIIARLTGKKVLMWTHGVKRQEHGLKKLFRLRFYRLAHGLLVYGHRAKNILVSWGIPPDSIYVVYNSLDHAQQLLNRATLQTLSTKRHATDTPRLVTVGRLTKTKRIDLLIDAAHRLARDYRDLVVTIVGDGPELPRLRQRVHELHMENHITFLGDCYDESQLAQLLAGATLTVVPGDIGLTCIHSLAYGTPVITHDNFDTQNPEFEAIKPGQTGDFYRAGNLESLVTTIDRWLKLLSQPASRDVVRERCYRIVDTYFTPDTQKKIIHQAVIGARPEDIL